MELVQQNVEKALNQDQGHVQTQLLLTEELIAHCLERHSRQCDVKSKTAQVSSTFSTVNSSSKLFLGGLMLQYHICMFFMV